MNKSENNSISWYYKLIAFNQHIHYTQSVFNRSIHTRHKSHIWRMLIKQDAFNKIVLHIQEIEFFFAKNDFETDFAQGLAFLQKSFFLTFSALHVSFWTFQIKKNIGLSKDFCSILTISDPLKLPSNPSWGYLFYWQLKYLPVHYSWSFSGKVATSNLIDKYEIN